jgi:hypothetical protein
LPITVEHLSYLAQVFGMWIIEYPVHAFRRLDYLDSRKVQIRPPGLKNIGQENKQKRKFIVQ